MGVRVAGADAADRMAPGESLALHEVAMAADFPTSLQNVGVIEEHEEDRQRLLAAQEAPRAECDERTRPERHPHTDVLKSRRARYGTRALPHHCHVQTRYCPE